MAGWVYVITNQAMPGLVKVGFTERHPDDRASDFNQRHHRTAIPFPFVVAYAAKVEDPRELEREIHQVLDHCRITKRTKNKKDEKEWFRCGSGHAVATIRRRCIDSIWEEIGPFETEEIMSPAPESSTESYSDTVERIRLANEHWLNQKALALLKENHIPSSGDALHIMTLLWSLSEYSDGYPQLAQPVREYRDGWSLDEILRMAESCSPENIIQLLTGELTTDADELPILCEDDMDQVNSIGDMFDLLWEPIDDFLLSIEDS